LTRRGENYSNKRGHTRTGFRSVPIHWMPACTLKTTLTTHVRVGYIHNYKTDTSDFHLWLVTSADPAFESEKEEYRFYL